ncbi:hypothetical protein [Flavobacterium sp. U410]
MKKTILYICFLILFSCEKSIKKETNREVDIIYGKSVVQDFYKNCDLKKYDEIYKNLSSELDTSIIKKIVLIKDSLGFKAKNYEIENLETFYTEVKDQDSISKKLEIHVFIKSYNENNSFSENINFLKINDESPKIVGYHIKG